LPGHRFSAANHQSESSEAIMHTVPFRLNENAMEFQAGEFGGFGIRTGVKYQDPKTKGEAWTNYKAAVFPKSQAQADYYRANLIKGALVVVTAEQQAVEVFDGQNGTQTAIKLLRANIVAVKADRAPDAAQQAYAKAAPQPVRAAKDFGREHQEAGALRAALPPGSFDSFDDDLPW